MVASCLFRRSITDTFKIQTLVSQNQKTENENATVHQVLNIGYTVTSEHRTQPINKKQQYKRKYFSGNSTFSSIKEDQKSNDYYKRKKKNKKKIFE